MVRGERVCASRSHSEKSSGRPPPKSTSLRKKAADGNLRRGRHSERPSADRLRYNALRRPPHPSSSPLRRPPLPPPSSHGTYVRMLVTYVRWVGSTTSRGRTHRTRQEDTHCASVLAAQRQRKVRRIVSVRTRCEGHAFENRCCRMNDIASQIQRKEERQELT